MKLLLNILISISILIMISGIGVCAITYDGRYIYVIGEGIGNPGGDWNNAYNFNDIWLADQNGGWGIVNKQGSYQYSFDSKIRFGDGSIPTYFSDNNKQVVAKNKWYPKDNSFINFGILLNATTKTTSSGIDFLWDAPSGSLGIYPAATSTAIVNYYGCSFKRTNRASYVTIKRPNHLYNCVLSKMMRLLRANGDIKRLTLSDSEDGISNSGGNFNDIIIEDSAKAIYATLQLDGLVFNNLKTLNVSTLIYAPFPAEEWNMYLINPDVENWVFSIHSENELIVHRQYTFNLLTTPKAQVTIMDKEKVVYQDYAYQNGTIDEQIFDYGFYRSSGKEFNNPYSIEIKRVGYHTYKQEFTLDAPINWCIRLVPDCVQVGSDIIRPCRRS